MKKIFLSITTLFVVVASANAQANTSLSNLSTTTAVNHSLTPNTTDTKNLGSTVKRWKHGYFSADVYVNGITVGHGGLDSLFNYNTAVGVSALSQNSEGQNNTAIGFLALEYNTEGSDNTAVGGYALIQNTTGRENTAVGKDALWFNSEGYENTGLGDLALYHNTTGNENTASGGAALGHNITGNCNSAFGNRALVSNETGYSNVAVGHYALFNNVSGSNLVAVGDSALYNQTGASYNTAIGNKTLFSNTTGTSNTALGYNALYTNTTSSANTAVGTYAMVNNTGSNNTALGAYAGYYPSTNSTFIGWDTYGITTGVTNSTAVGYHAPTTANNQVRLGDINVTSIGGAVGWSVLSDGRYKKNINENVPGLGFINQLRPVTYNYDADKFSAALNAATKRPGDANVSQPSQEEKAAATAKSKIVYTGFIAQEVEAAAKKINYDFSGVDAPKNSNDYYGLRYSDFVVPLVKAVQELSAKNEDLQNQINELKSLISKGNNATSFSSANGYLKQNIPNPATNNTVISYYLPENTGKAQITLTDAKGSAVKVFNATKGEGTINITSAELPAGTYNYTLSVNNKNIDNKRMVITK